MKINTPAGVGGGGSGPSGQVWTLKVGTSVMPDGGTGFYNKVGGLLTSPSTHTQHTHRHTHAAQA